jgi:hypothetical protein
MWECAYSFLLTHKASQMLSSQTNNPKNIIKRIIYIDMEWCYWLVAFHYYQ